ncbi:MAG: hypothetical protein CL920_34545 [Deltaproteobacteria bacterium]|nr:hypothetical protein [Deltaproteobacteria bacterium]
MPPPRACLLALEPAPTRMLFSIFRPFALTGPLLWTQQQRPPDQIYRFSRVYLYFINKRLNTLESRMKNPKKHIQVCLFILTLSTILSGFAFARKSLKYTEDRTPSTLNPLYAQDMYSVRITEGIFEGLFGWDKMQRLAPQLATSWKLSKDKKTMTIKLRKGVLWHDGKNFTSKDVVFTIKAMISRRTNLQDRYLAQIINSASVLGKHSLQLHFKKQLRRPRKWLCFKILPAHKFPRGHVRRTQYFSQKPVGTGPFRFVRWTGKKIILKRFKRYWRTPKKESLRGVILQSIPDKGIQAEVLRFGGIDNIVRVRPKDLPLFERSKHVRLYPYTTNSWWYLGLNHRRQLFRDKRVREALMLALDRDTLREATLGDGTTISGPFSPNDPLYNFQVSARSQDLKRARALLKKAGWRRKGGFLYKGPRQLKINLILSKSKRSYRPMVLGIIDQLRKVGVKVKVTWLQHATWRKKIFSQRAFDMTLHIWNFDSLSSIHPLFHSKGSLNYIGYKNKQVDILLKKVAKTTDPVIYKTIFGKLHAILHADLPYLFLWSLTNYSAITARVRNVTIHPFNYFHYIHSWKKVEEE